MTDPEMLSWLREAIEAKLWKARSLAAYGDGSGAWAVTRNDDFDYTINFAGDAGLVGVDAVADIWREDAAEFIADNSPRDVIARCEAELAILDEHYILAIGDQPERYGGYSVLRYGGYNKDRGCVTCHYEGRGAVRGAGVCVTVRLLAAGYRHRTGWKAEWAA